MEKIVYVWKPVRLTPLEVISLFKQKYPMHKDEKISYAGRLDPMAEGILILLIGNENKNRDKYLGLDKVYESEIIFGISTDSFEGLGKIIDVNFDSKISEEGIRNVLNNLMGERIQEYPPFSSKTVSGKPLFWWAREGKIDQIRIPKRKIKIHAID
jgi:tRNA pseudouridine55 synthase